MFIINDLNEETRRHQADAEGIYDAWLAAQKTLSLGALTWRRVSGGDYLYRLRGTAGYGASLGPASPQNNEIYDAHKNAQRSSTETWNRLHLYGGLINRVGRAVSVPEYAGKILRELDIQGALGVAVWVVGTHALAAYAAEAGVAFGPDVTATQDLDLSRLTSSIPLKLLDLIKETDKTFTVNQEKTFQVRNSRGHELDILGADAAPNDQISPMVITGQQWLHQGRAVTRVVFDSKLLPAKIVAPDPRMFALHKMWLSQQPERNPLKRTKDAKQALAVMETVVTRMPHYPMDDTFVAQLPAPLRDVIHHFPVLSSVEPAAGYGPPKPR